MNGSLANATWACLAKIFAQTDASASPIAKMHEREQTLIKKLRQTVTGRVVIRVYSSDVRYLFCLSYMCVFIDNRSPSASFWQRNTRWICTQKNYCARRMKRIRHGCRSIRRKIVISLRCTTVTRENYDRRSDGYNVFGMIIFVIYCRVASLTPYWLSHFKLPYQSVSGRRWLAMAKPTIFRDPISTG